MRMANGSRMPYNVWYVWDIGLRNTWYLMKKYRAKVPTR